MTISARGRKVLRLGFFGLLLGAGGLAARGDIRVPNQPTVCPQQPVVSAACQAANTLMVNTRRIRLNYELQDVGPSGVSRVELWATRDGQSWQRYSDDPPTTGPLVLHVAEEGRYGFTVVARSGVGVLGRRPSPGDQPQVWVIVDETAPVMQLHEAKVGQGESAGTLEVRWSASDAHLKAHPYTISYAASPEGPWQPIARDLDRDRTSFVWSLPKEVPYRFWVRVEAVDRAGNVGQVTSPRPVLVDHAQPRGVITTVEPAQPAAPQRPMLFTTTAEE
jgi:hypothetical protein